MGKLYNTLPDAELSPDSTAAYRIQIAATVFMLGAVEGSQIQLRNSEIELISVLHICGSMWRPQSM